MSAPWASDSFSERLELYAKSSPSSSGTDGTFRTWRFAKKVRVIVVPAAWRCKKAIEAAQAQQGKPYLSRRTIPRPLPALCRASIASHMTPRANFSPSTKKPAANEPRGASNSGLPGRDDKKTNRRNPVQIGLPQTCRSQADPGGPQRTLPGRPWSGPGRDPRNHRSPPHRHAHHAAAHSLPQRARRFHQHHRRAIASSITASKCPTSIAGILLAGIVSDTLNLTSPTTTHGSRSALDLEHVRGQREGVHRETVRLSGSVLSRPAERPSPPIAKNTSSKAAASASRRSKRSVFCNSGSGKAGGRSGGKLQQGKGLLHGCVACHRCRLQSSLLVISAPETF